VTISSELSCTASVQAFKDSWYRITATFTTGATVTTPTDPTFLFRFTGTSGVTVLGYGTQLEAGAFSTSYIPTTTTSLTRNADVVSMTGTNFSDWYSASEGTVSVEVQPIASITAGYPRILSITDNTNSNEISLAYDNATPAVYAVVRTSNVNVAVLPKNIDAADRTAKIVVVGAYKTNSFAATTKGLSPATGTSGNLPTVNRMNIGCGPIDTGSAFINAWLSKISYWPQRLINNEVQAFSKR
jgi:hypothetical protein